jgi:hypothetical protein
VRLTVIALALAAFSAFNADEPAWRIEISTSGGVTGRGVGGMSVSADGALAPRSGCALRLTESDLRAISELVDKAKPEEWKPSYVTPANPHGCCDQVKTTLTLTRGEKRWTSTWYNDHLPMPADLEAIADALFSNPKSVRSRYKAQCGRP